MWLDFSERGGMPSDVPMDGKMRLFSRKYIYLSIYFFFEVQNMADLPIAAVVRMQRRMVRSVSAAMRLRRSS